MGVLLAVPAHAIVRSADALTSTDTNYEFGTIAPGGTGHAVAFLHNPTGHDIAFTPVLGGSPPPGATISATPSVVPAGQNQLVDLALTIPAADGDADYNFPVDFDD